MTQGGYPGIGRATEGLVLHLLTSASPHRLALIYQIDRPIPDHLQDSLVAPHHFLPVSARLRTVRDQVELPIRLRQAGIDLYHSPYYGMAVLPGVRYVVDLHDTIPILYPEYWSLIEARLIRAWQRRVVTHAACVITGSEAAATDIRQTYPIGDKPIVVTPWGTVEWTASARAPATNVDVPYLLCVCANKPHKNLVRLIQGYQLASEGMESFPDLVITGSWSDRYPEPDVAAASVNANSAHCKVRFLRNVGDGELRYIYEHALGFVFPSLYEGFGLPVLEAMQAGLPVAASTTPAVAEVAGQAALSFNPLNVTAIATAIKRLATEPRLRESLSQAGADRLRAFSWQTTARRTLHAYEVALCE